MNKGLNRAREFGALVNVAVSVMVCIYLYRQLCVHVLVIMCIEKIFLDVMEVVAFLCSATSIDCLKSAQMWLDRSGLCAEI